MEVGSARIGNQSESEKGKSAATLKIENVDTDKALTDRAESAFAQTLTCFKEPIVGDRSYPDDIGQHVEAATLQNRNDPPTVLSLPAKT